MLVDGFWERSVDSLWNVVLEQVVELVSVCVDVTNVAVRRIL